MSATAEPIALTESQPPDDTIRALGERFDFHGVLARPGPVKHYRVSDRRRSAPAGESNVDLILRVLSVDDLEAARLGLFLAQARAGSLLEHESITPVVESGELNGVYYCLLRFPSEFETLRSLMLRNGWLDIEGTVARGVILKVSDALACAHRKGILHLAVRPEDILIDRSGKAFLTGFGMAYRDITPFLLAELATQIESQYVSPELLAGETVTERSDLYSLGATLYEMITDRIPQTARLERRPNRAAIAPHLLMDSISPAVSRLIMRMLEYVPENRFRDMADFQDAVLRTILPVEAVKESPDWHLDLMDPPRVLVKAQEPDPLHLAVQGRNAGPLPERAEFSMPAFDPAGSPTKRDLPMFQQVEGKTRIGRALFLAAALIVLVSAGVLIATQRSVDISKTAKPAESEQVLSEPANRPGGGNDRADSVNATTTTLPAVGSGANVHGSLGSNATANWPSFRKHQKKHRRSLPKSYWQPRLRPYGRRPGYY
jgi:serine/threonine protein kinase